jgi:hypothetical protein
MREDASYALLCEPIDSSQANLLVGQRVERHMKGDVKVTSGIHQSLYGELVKPFVMQAAKHDTVCPEPSGCKDVGFHDVQLWFRILEVAAARANHYHNGNASVVRRGYGVLHGAVGWRSSANG